MKSNPKKNLVAILASVVLILALVNFSITFYKIHELNQKITGFASTNYGYVNLTINTLTQLTISRESINWGAGLVNVSGGWNNATLITHGDFNGTVLGGNWTNNTDLAKAIVIKNSGNLNVSLKLQSSHNAYSFIGGSNPSPLFQWNISNNGTSVACGEWNETSAQNVFADVNTTQAVICNKFNYGGNPLPMMFIDVKLLIPSSANRTDTALNATFTITGDTAI